MLDKIYIARHGFRINWVMDNWKNVTGTERDPTLSAFGEEQARELAQYFSSLPESERPTAIFSSPFYRCLQTAKPVATALGLPLYVEHGIAEWYSPVKPGTGLHPRPSSAASLKQHFDEIDPSWSSIWYPSRRGEPVNDLIERARGFLELLHSRIGGRKDLEHHKRVLLVSHAATVIALARALTGDEEVARKLRVSCCSVTTLNRIREGPSLGAYKSEALASASHLSQGALRDWGFEDITLDENGQVVEDLGVPGSENEEDAPVGPQLLGSESDDQDLLARL